MARLLSVLVGRPVTAIIIFRGESQLLNPQVPVT